MPPIADIPLAFDLTSLDERCDEIMNRIYCDTTPPRALPIDLTFRVLTANDSFTERRNVMAGYRWHRLTSLFLAQNPDRSLELFDFILAQDDGLSSIRTGSYSSQIADKIAESHPQEVWERVANVLLTGDSHTRFVVTHWLGDSGFEDRPQFGAIRLFPVNQIITWIEQDRDNRLWKIFSALPKTLDDIYGGQLTRLMIEKNEQNENFCNSLCTYFTTGGWSGPESAYLGRKRDEARRWYSEIPSLSVQRWLSKYIDHLSQRITAAEIQEERGY